MSTLPTEPEQPTTAAQVEQWIYTAQRKRLALHVQATEPWNSRQRHEALMEMSDLLKEAIEDGVILTPSFVICDGFSQQETLPAWGLLMTLAAFLGLTLPPGDR